MQKALRAAFACLRCLSILVATDSSALFVYLVASLIRPRCVKGPTFRPGIGAHVIIFDCNGVLVDSEPLATAIVSQEFIRAGFALTPDIVARYFTCLLYTSDA